VLGPLRRNRLERPAYLLYGTAVAAARVSWFYAELGVADSVDGRFDMVSLHVFLVIRRLGELPAPGAAMAQAVFDAMFSDMDVNLREMGVGDLAVGKRNRALWEAFHGRSAAYQEALAATDDAALVAALERNVWRGVAPAGAAGRLAGYVRGCEAGLAEQDIVALAAGRVAFPSVPA
jgi:cytochrome b pre-mRNA-processing protein 3